jgi:DNA-binding protein HU-beta
MNNKELINAISAKADLTRQEVEHLLDVAVKVCSDELIDSKTIAFQGFGNFEVRKREERLSVHPATQIRTLIPPKLVVNFKQSNILKDKLKEIHNHG